MFRASCRFNSSKSASRHNSSVSHARHWRKPLSNTEPNPPDLRSPTRILPREASSSRQSSYSNDGRPSTRNSKDNFGARESHLHSRTPPTSREQDKAFGASGYQRLAPERFRHDKSTPQEYQSTSSEGEVSGSSQLCKRRPSLESYRHYERSSSSEKRSQHRRSARTGGEESRYPARGDSKDNLDELKEALQDARFIETRPRNPQPAKDYSTPPASKTHKRPAEAPVIRPEDAVTYFESNVSSWALHSGTIQRIVSYGVPEADTRILLERFVRDVKAGILSSDAIYYSLDRFGHPHDENSIDIIYSTTFFSWAARLDELSGVNPQVLLHIQRLVEATNRPFPSDEFPFARRLRRKVIMHIGPTNSGKTHHALRALAAASSGVYAGPLRLLAHEIFQRLNSGSIVPLGVAQDPAAPAGPNPAHARLCNMVTGEEMRVVSDDATLLSCTVEMLSTNVPCDVAVIDEIQMIGDPDRGASWTQAVLGLAVKELHLCGEETAVPVVQALLAQTRDEIEIRRYDRLTPLTVDENVLDGDLSKIQKGDCIVTFSRSSIFALKKEVERATGMRCAVVYGRLPPETRNEQAALFNDQNSGYDVIIGSDAIGMGLNLKIRRVIFAATSKFDGQDDVPLQVSTVKQIAGRAGRFGMHKGDLGGSATTMYKEDFPHLKHCIAQPYKPLSSAQIALSEEHISKLLSMLPPEAGSIARAMSAGQYIGRLPSFLRYSSARLYDHASEFVQRHWADMTVKDKTSLFFAPIPWREHRVVDMITPLLKQHKEQGTVTFFETMEPTGLVKVLDSVEQMIAQGNITAVATPTSSTEAVPAPAYEGKPKLGPGLAQRRRMAAENLVQLENFHKVVVLYMWWSFRLPIIYAEGEEVEKIKHRLEAAMNGLLTMMSSQLTESVGLKSMVHGKTKAPANANAVVDLDQKLVETLQALG